MPLRPSYIRQFADTKRNAVGSGGVFIWGVGSWSTDKVWGVNDSARGIGETTGRARAGQWGRFRWSEDTVWG